MTRVISIHHYQLKPGVTAEQFQSVIKNAEELRLFELSGLEAYSFLQGIKGEEQGLWIALWVYTSRSEWEQLWGTPLSRNQSTSTRGNGRVGRMNC